MLSQSEIIKRAIERVADAEIEKKTAPCFRTYKAIVTEAPNGTTCKVRLVGDDTELTLPYASKLSEITAGKFVWVGAFYNVDNSFSNAIVWETLKMDVGGGGGSTVTVDGIYYLTNNGSIAADTTKPYYAARWITTNDNVTSYFDGMTVAVKVPVAGNGTYGTVLSINGLGEHPVIRNVSTMVGTTYGVGCMLVLTYDANASDSAYINSNSATSIQGVWKVSDYDSTIVYRLEQYYTTPAVNANAGALYRYEICFSKLDGTIVPANNQSNKTTTYNKVLNDEPFDPFGNIYYYLSTTAVAAGDPVAANTLYRVYLGDIRYSFNINSGGTSGTTALTSHEPIYIKALYNKTTKMAMLTQDLTSANYLERSGLVQDLPSTNPNTGLASNQMYIYILLGYAYNKYQFDLAALHQVYAWDTTAQSATVFFGESDTSASTTDPDAFHKTDIIPLENGGTGLDGGSALTWYDSPTLHPHFEIMLNAMTGVFTVSWIGPLDGISSVNDFFASDYFEYAQRTTHPLYLGSTSAYAGSAILFTGAFDTTPNIMRLYFVFPDAVLYYGNYVNGLSGTLVYDASDGIYIDPSSMTPSVPKWVNLLAQKEDASNKVTSISSSSTNTEYPSAKAVYDAVQAGVTDIPSSSVNFDDLPKIGDYAGPSGTGRFVTFLQNETGDTYTNPYLLDTPVAMMYRVKTDSIAMNNGLGIGRQKLGITGASASYIGSTNTLFGMIANTPIMVDTTTYAPTSNLITDGIKLGFRFVGSVIYADNSEAVIDTYAIVSYSSTSGWSVSYTIFGNRDFAISLSTTFKAGRLSIIVGPAATQETFEKTLSDFKVFRYCNLRIDYMGASTGDYPSGTSDLSGLIEPSSGWLFSFYQHDNTQTWTNAVSAVQPNILGTLLDAKENISNKVTTIDSSSTDDQYPSAKLLYDTKNTLSGLIQDVDEAIPSKMDMSKQVFTGTCTTAAGTAAKTVNVGDGFELEDGVKIRVYMNTANTNTTPTLNVNSTGAKRIAVSTPRGKISNAVLSANYISAFMRNGWFNFVYVASYNSGAGVWLIEDAPFTAGSLGNARATRPTSINFTNDVNGGVKYDVVASGITGNPFNAGCATLTMFHDTGEYTRQIAMAATIPPQMAFRAYNGSWQPWEYVLTSANELENHMATLAYTASGVDFSTGGLTLPLNGTQYKLLQLTVFNMDISYTLGNPALFLFNANGTTGYKTGTTTYCTVSSTASAITITFDSSFGLIGSTNVDITALYRRIS